MFVKTQTNKCVQATTEIGINKKKNFAITKYIALCLGIFSKIFFKNNSQLFYK